MSTQKQSNQTQKGQQSTQQDENKMHQGMSKPDAETEKTIKLFVNDKEVHRFSAETKIRELASHLLGNKEGFLFLADEEKPLDLDKTLAELGIDKQGHIHTATCRQVKVSVEYAGQSLQHQFPPTVQIKAIQHWAVGQKWNPPIDPAERSKFALFLPGDPDPLQEANRLANYVPATGCGVTLELAYRSRQQG